MTKPFETTVALIKHEGIISIIECTGSSFSFKDGNIHLEEFSGVLSFNPKPAVVENKEEDDEINSNKVNIYGSKESS
jgi:hypothetical protein